MSDIEFLICLILFGAAFLLATIPSDMYKTIQDIRPKWYKDDE